MEMTQVTSEKEEYAIKKLMDACGITHLLIIGFNADFTAMRSLHRDITPHSVIAACEMEKHRLLAQTQRPMQVLQPEGDSH